MFQKIYYLLNLYKLIKKFIIYFLAPPGRGAFLSISPKNLNANESLRRPSTSPLPFTRNANNTINTLDTNSNSPKIGKLLDAGMNATAALFHRRQGRSLSLRDTDPASLILGDFLVAPLYEWAEKMRIQKSTSCVNGVINCTGSANGNGSDGNANSNGASDDMDSSSQLWAGGQYALWNKFSACSPQRRRSSEPFVAGT